MKALKFLLGLIAVLFLGLFAFADCTAVLELASKSLSCLSNDTVDGLVAGASLAGAVIPAKLKLPSGEDFEVKSSEDVDKLDESGKKAYYENWMKAQTHTLTNLKSELAKAETDAKKELEKEIGSLIKSQNAVMEKTLKLQGEKMAELEKTLSGKLASTPEEKNLVMKALKENSDKIKQAISEKRGFTLELEGLKASMDAATDIADGQDFATMEPGVGQIPTRRVFMRNLFSNRPINTEWLKYTDQATKVRDAKNVAQCGTTTHTSKITYGVIDLQMKKVRDFVDICVDMWEDYDFIAGEVRSLVNDNVALQVDSQLLLGDGTGANLNGVAAAASTFAAGDYATSIQEPTLADLIIVAAAQIADFGQNNKFQANVAILNPVDATKMRLEKDLDNNYLLPNFVSAGGREVAGVQIIENQLVPAGQFYIMDTRMGTIYNRKGVTVELAFENRSNFETEVVTVKAYERLNLRIRNVDANAFMHVPDIAAALTAITAV